VGGVEVVVDQLARALGARGHHVEQVAARARGDSSQPVAPGGATVHTAAAWNVIEARAGLPYPLFGPGLISLLRRRIADADVVHAHGFLFQASGVSLAMARRHAKRHGGTPARVLTDHGGRGAYDSGLVRAVESVAVHTLGVLSVRSAQAVNALNPRVEGQMRALGPATEMLTIPNGVDRETYRPSAPSERAELRESLGWDERPRALFVGRLVPRKGADLAVEAARRLPELELVLAGPGDPGAELPANATALGELSRERVADLYRAADLMVLPSTAEGFPLTAQEALASGLPIVLADDPAYGPYLDDAPEGVGRVERSVDALEAGLRELDLGRAIGPDGRERLVEFARERFSWERAAEQHESLYRRLLREGRR
jgi:D-inositol-3-phosphate glycosyltransferase